MSIIRFKLQKSYSLSIILALIYISSVICIVLLPLCLLLRIVLLLGSFIYFFATLRLSALKNSGNAVVEFWQNSDGLWYLQRKSGHIEQGALNLPIFVSNYLVILNFTLKKKYINRTAVIITADAMTSKDSFRKLKFLLKTNKNLKLSEL